MNVMIEHYRHKLIAEQVTLSATSGIASQNDTVFSVGNEFYRDLATAVLINTGNLAVVAALPSWPFADFLIKRSGPDATCLVPRDTETRTFLHDIPLVRMPVNNADVTDSVCRALANRKGCLLEGVGIIAAGPLTVEQAYANWSSVFHATFVKYLEDLLETGFQLPGERETFSRFRTEWLRPLNAEQCYFSNNLTTGSAICEELVRVGRFTVEKGLVDSFFGNISYGDRDTIYISQTAAALDQLEGCIDPVPRDMSSTIGITASSEYELHRRIIETQGCRAVLHGHPRFAVIMSMVCEQRTTCLHTDCWRECLFPRSLKGIPIVTGEIGAGGIAETVPKAMNNTGAVIVYGHGVFTLGDTGFEEAFLSMIQIENTCRDEYLRLIDERWCRE